MATPLSPFKRKMRTKMRNPLSSAGGGLAPMPSMAAELQPSTPAVNYFGLGGGGTGAMLPTGANTFARNSAGNVEGQQPAGSYQSMTALNKDMERFGPSLLRRPAGGVGGAMGGAGGAPLPDQIDP